MTRVLALRDDFRKGNRPSQLTLSVNPHTGTELTLNTQIAQWKPLHKAKNPQSVASSMKERVKKYPLPQRDDKEMSFPAVEVLGQ